MKSLQCPLSSKLWRHAACVVVAGAGCAHHRADNYTYAPPYAPPVYPQQVAAAQPVSYAAPVAGAPVVAAPVTMQPGPVVAGQSQPCLQPCQEGNVATAPVVVGGSGQTPPCPPGP